jgi:hypothetical protein
VPVVDIAMGLDIVEVRQQALDGCEGALLTDRVRSRGSILVNDSRGRARARFSIAHELGHFLLERHELRDEIGFACRSADMRESGTDSADHRQETEANAFAINLLAPPSLINMHLRGAPDFSQILAMRDGLRISLEAAARRYVDCHDAQLAVVFSRDGHVRYVDRQRDFPWIDLENGGPLHRDTEAARFIRSGENRLTAMQETTSLFWINRPEVALAEQTRLGRDGYAVTLLWAEQTEPEDDEEDDGGLEELDMPRFR